MQRLAEKEGVSGGQELPFLRTHPLTTDRVADSERNIPEALKAREDSGCNPQMMSLFKDMFSVR